MKARFYRERPGVWHYRDAVNPSFFLMMSFDSFEQAQRYFARREFTVRSIWVCDR